MKKIAAIIGTLILAYSIYFDLTVGTLPSTAAKTVNMKTSDYQTTEPFILIEIKPGDTVLSVLEQIQQGPLPVSITEAVSDFEELNAGIKPEQIQTGKNYKFPDYRSMHD